MKWYNRLLIALLVLIFSPLLIVALIIVLIAFLVELAISKKRYKKSLYYQQFKVPFAIGALDSPGYRFYNYYKDQNLQLEYIRQESNNLEYFTYNGTLFLFPDFQQMDLNEKSSLWEVNYDGTWIDLEEAYTSMISEIDHNDENLPIKILVERKMICVDDLREIQVPEHIFVTWSYDSAFQNEDSPFKLRIPTNEHELYEMMLATPGLCGEFKATESGMIYWDLGNGFVVKIGVDTRDCYIEVDKKIFKKGQWELTHWHPTNDEIYEEVCNLGMEGNVLVIRTVWGGASVLYMGDEKGCPYSEDTKKFFGKVYYLRATKEN